MKRWIVMLGLVSAAFAGGRAARPDTPAPPSAEVTRSANEPSSTPAGDRCPGRDVQVPRFADVLTAFEAVPAGRITGLIDAAEEIRGPISVRLLPDGPGGPTRETVMNADGTFEFAGLAKGAYVVVATAGGATPRLERIEVPDGSVALTFGLWAAHEETFNLDDELLRPALVP